MAHPRAKGKIKWQLYEFECDNCDKGVVQILILNNFRKNETTQTVSGCLNCKKSFGIGQASKLQEIKL